LPPKKETTKFCVDEIIGENVKKNLFAAIPAPQTG
jgi:hypothetical protein